MSSSHSAESPINRAHALSAKASQIAQLPSTPENLRRAKDLYDQATGLFEKVSRETSDAGAVSTLNLLAAQNRKKSKDLGRRAAVTAAARTSSASVVPGNSGRADHTQTKAGQGLATIVGRQRRRRPGVESSYHEGLPSSYGAGHTHDPPFARPSPSLDPKTLPFSSTPHPPSNLSINESVPDPNSGFRSGTASTLYASSSSSERGGTGDSYVKFGHPLDSSDPFARFWAVLETAFDQISNPVAFAAMPLDVPRAGDEGGDARSRDRERDRSVKRREKGKEREKESVPEPESSSSMDSFYVISKESRRTSFSDPGASTPSTTSTLRPAVKKTPEELELENENLRASLDALSVHNQKVEEELRRVRQRDEKRGEMMKSVVLGVKLEAQKAMQSQELFRSQMLASGLLSPPGQYGTMSRSIRPSPSMHLRSASPPAFNRLQLDSKPSNDGPVGAAASNDASLRKRVVDLEEQIRLLQAENERARSHLQKYRDRFERLKTSARAKKEAKLTAAGTQIPSHLATLGEEDGEI